MPYRITILALQLEMTYLICRCKWYEIRIAYLDWTIGNRN